MNTVLFACLHNAGRSQMAAALFNRLADPEQAHAESAGTRPADQVHPEVVAVMEEVGLHLADAIPRYLTDEIAAMADVVVTMGCGDECPVVPGAEREDWALPDPKGLPLEEVRAIRADIEARVTTLVAAHGWARAAARQPA